LEPPVRFLRNSLFMKESRKKFRINDHRSNEATSKRSRSTWIGTVNSKEARLKHQGRCRDNGRWEFRGHKGSALERADLRRSIVGGAMHRRKGKV